MLSNVQIKMERKHCELNCESQKKFKKNSKLVNKICSQK